MNLKGKNVGFAFTGSFYSFPKTILELKKIIDLEANVIPIMSFNAYYLDTNFKKAKDFRKAVKEITCKEIIHTIQNAEAIGRKNIFDVLIIAPCTGNTLSKLACDITDSPVLLATKSHLRNSKPVVIAISTNNGLSGNAENIGKLLNRKHYFFVPFKQNNPITKPYSISFSPSYIIPTIEHALENKQLQPLLL